MTITGNQMDSRRGIEIHKVYNQEDQQTSIMENPSSATIAKWKAMGLRIVVVHTVETVLLFSTHSKTQNTTLWIYAHKHENYLTQNHERHE